MNNSNKKLETAIFAGGCFWCFDPMFSRLKGVEEVIVGYAGGNTSDPTYEKIHSGSTGHAEAIKIAFDPEIITYEDLLNIFFLSHDPTTLNRQGNDIGSEYRSLVLYGNEKQKEIAEKVREEIENKKIYPNPIVTEIKKLEKFYPAEIEHQKYFEKNPERAYCQLIIMPKLQKFKKKYYHFLKNDS